MPHMPRAPFTHELTTDDERALYELHTETTHYQRCLSGYYTVLHGRAAEALVTGSRTVHTNAQNDDAQPSVDDYHTVERYTDGYLPLEGKLRFADTMSKPNLLLFPPELLADDKSKKRQSGAAAAAAQVSDKFLSATAMQSRLAALLKSEAAASSAAAHSKKGSKDAFADAQSGATSKAACAARNKGDESDDGAGELQEEEDEATLSDENDDFGEVFDDDDDMGDGEEGEAEEAY